MQNVIAGWRCDWNITALHGTTIVKGIRPIQQAS